MIRKSNGSFLSLITHHSSLITLLCLSQESYLVTGGAGFIGSHIAASLAGAGARVRVLDDLSTGHAENLEEIGGDVEFVRGEPDR